MKPSKLTPKQEAFAKAYIETGNASEAYRRAYNAGKMKDQAVHVKASELLKHGKVAGRVAELQAAHQKRHEITVDSLTDMLKEDRELARREGEANAAINAVLAIAKLHGLIIDSKNVNLNANHKHHHTAEPLSESAHWLAKLLGAGADSAAAQPLH
jgi:phage terminase small subunit